MLHINNIESILDVNQRVVKRELDISIVFSAPLTSVLSACHERERAMRTADFSIAGRQIDLPESACGSWFLNTFGRHGRLTGTRLQRYSGLLPAGEVGAALPVEIFLVAGRFPAVSDDPRAPAAISNQSFTRTGCPCP